jgi:hypothetical protein
VTAAIADAVFARRVDSISRTWLLWLRNDSARDSRRRASGNFHSHRVNHKGSSPVAEDGIAVGAESDAWSGHTRAGSAILAHRQNKIRDVTRRQAGGTVLAVARARGIEVGSGRLEVWQVAFRELVNVHQVRARRQVPNIQPNLHAVRPIGKHRRSDAPALRIYDVHSDGPRRGVLLAFLCENRRNGKCKQECRTRHGSHHASPSLVSNIRHPPEGLFHSTDGVFPVQRVVTLLSSHALCLFSLLISDEGNLRENEFLARICELDV